ncbi:hypothetical protein QQZ08_001482 [Neonectria magnoliae]|uniref:HSF-type DNA-binding domain-containing protein n=1 Tax=Neonectria magnoliae TaxID=2732573 RepID=A0ABR1IF05_9HYPO
MDSFTQNNYQPQTNGTAMYTPTGPMMGHSQPSVAAPLIMATTSVHRLPVALLDSQAPHQPNQTLSYDEEHYLVVDSFIWAFDDSKRSSVFDWVKGLKYNQYWCWKQERSFKKMLKTMRKQSVQYTGRINNTFNLALAQMKIFNVRVLPHGPRTFQFFALSDDRIKVERQQHNLKQQTEREDSYVPSSPIREDDYPRPPSYASTPCYDDKSEMGPPMPGAWVEDEPVHMTPSPIKRKPLPTRQTNVPFASRPLAGDHAIRKSPDTVVRRFPRVHQTSDDFIPGAWVQDQTYEQSMGFRGPHQRRDLKSDEFAPGAWVEDQTPEQIMGPKKSPRARAQQRPHSTATAAARIAMQRHTYY